MRSAAGDQKEGGHLHSKYFFSVEYAPKSSGVGWGGGEWRLIAKVTGRLNIPKTLLAIRGHPATK